MKKRLKYLLPVALLSISLSVNAQKSQDKVVLTPEVKAKKMTERMTKELNLTENQKTAVYELSLKNIQEKRALKAKMKAERERRKVAMEVRRERKEGELNAILTPEQRKKLTVLKAERKEKMKAKKGERREHIKH